jgi:hypothetical protein
MLNLQSITNTVFFIYTEQMSAHLWTPLFPILFGVKKPSKPQDTFFLIISYNYPKETDHMHIIHPIWDRCYDFLNIFVKKNLQKIGVFD